MNIIIDKLHRIFDEYKHDLNYNNDGDVNQYNGVTDSNMASGLIRVGKLALDTNKLSTLSQTMLSSLIKMEVVSKCVNFPPPPGDLTHTELICAILSSPGYGINPYTLPWKEATHPFYMSLWYTLSSKSRMVENMKPIASFVEGRTDKGYRLSVCSSTNQVFTYHDMQPYTDDDIFMNNVASYLSSTMSDNSKTHFQRTHVSKIVSPSLTTNTVTDTLFILRKIQVYRNNTMNSK
jgi:hypothetical protein